MVRASVVMPTRYFDYPGEYFPVARGSKLGTDDRFCNEGNARHTSAGE